MLSIARGLMVRPRILLLDEPSMGLAPLLVQQIFDVVTRLNSEFGTTILLVEQNAQMALNVAQRAYVLQSGLMTHADTAANLKHDETIIASYLGARPDHKSDSSPSEHSRIACSVMFGGSAYEKRPVRPCL
jgi:branched-chain amino acid transport system ATP-binding protein